jgi:peptidylprolyl isomerase
MKTMSNETTTNTGLRMLEVIAGTGQTPKIGDTVLMHYEYYLSEGVTSSDFNYDLGEYREDHSTIYDSTYEDKPFNGPIDVTIGKGTPKDDVYIRGDSIKGIDEALLHMKVGSKRKLIIPSSLAYGTEGASSFHTFHGYRVPPNSDLTMTIELVEIKNETV